jgi:hypothetical protein
MMVASIDERHADGGVSEGACGVEPAKPAADDHDVRLSRHGPIERGARRASPPRPMDADPHGIRFARIAGMAGSFGFRQRAMIYGANRLARRLGISVPIVGAAVAAVLLGSAVRRKGLLGGTFDTALNAVPFVGAAKNLYEMLRGDLIPDRVPHASSRASSSSPPHGDPLARR